MSSRYLSFSRPIGVAHRGGDGGPENSLPAFRHAYQLGYRYLETDVRVTKDGKLVLFHDASVHRLTGVEAQLADLTWNELQQLSLQGSDVPIALLEDLLKQFPDARINIDPKCEEAVRPLLELLADPEIRQRVCIASFSGKRVARIRRSTASDLVTAQGGWKLYKLLFAALIGWPISATTTCVQTPHLYRPKWLGRWVIRNLQRAGIPVFVWTLNSEDAIRSALDVGVDAIMTDRVELLQSVLNEHRDVPAK